MTDKHTALKVIADLRAKSRRFEEAARTLEEAYEVKGMQAPRPKLTPATESRSNEHGSSSDQGGRGDDGPTRLEQIKAYLEEHGPSRRGEIVKGTGAPTGTVSYLLGEKDEDGERKHFEPTGDGKWRLKRPEDSLVPMTDQK